MLQQVSITDTFGYVQTLTDYINQGIQFLGTYPEVGLGIALVLAYLLVRAGWAVVEPILLTVFFPLRIIKWIL